MLLVMASTEAKYILEPIYEYRGPQAPLSKDGRVLETAEVLRARNAHMAAHAEALSRIRDIERNDYNERMMTMTMTMMRPTTSPITSPMVTSPMMTMRTSSRTRSIAPLSPDGGRVLDTPEVNKKKKNKQKLKRKNIQVEQDYPSRNIFSYRSEDLLAR